MNCESCEKLREDVNKDSSIDNLMTLATLNETKPMIVLNTFSGNAGVLHMDEAHAKLFHEMVSKFCEEHMCVSPSNRHYDGKGFTL